MASVKTSLIALVLLVLCDVIRGAPVLKPSNVASNSHEGQGTEVGVQEREIEDLLNLVKSQDKDKPVAIQTQVQSHVQNINGQVTEVQEKEEKVIDTANGNVVADVKEKVQQIPSGDDGKPKVKVETKVDIPSANIHETIEQKRQAQDTSGDSPNPDLQSAAESAILEHDVKAMKDDVNDIADDSSNVVDEREDEEGDEPDLRPIDMATFLYATQQLDAFYPALEKMVNQSKMTPDEAEAYAEQVVLLYQQLQQQQSDMAMDAYAAKRDEQAALDLYGDSPLTPNAFGMEEDTLAAQPPSDAFGYNEGYISPQEAYMLQLQLQQQQQQQEEENQQYAYSNDQTFDPIDFLTVLYESAYGKGNPEAQEILRLLYDRVSHDNNPDDIEQIRDLLLETITSSLSEGSQGNGQPWSLPLSMENVMIPEFGPMPIGDTAPAGFGPVPLGNMMPSRFMPGPLSLDEGDDVLGNAIDEEKDEDEEANDEASPNVNAVEDDEAEDNLEEELSHMNQKEKREVEETQFPDSDDKTDEDKPKSGEDKEDN